MAFNNHLNTIRHLCKTTPFMPNCGHCLTAICNYSEQDKKHRLALNVGDVLIICKETQHWYYGHLKSEAKGGPHEKGIFPKSYVQILDSVKQKNEYVIKRTEIVEEITRVLLEWRDLLNHFYLVSIYFRWRANSP